MKISRRQLLIGAGALVAGYAGLELAGLGPLSSKQEPLSELSIEELQDRFSKLEPTLQREILTRIHNEADEASGMKKVYDSITKETILRLIHLKDYKEVGKENKHAKEVYDKYYTDPSLYVFGYDEILDVIVMPNNASAELYDLIRHRKTFGMHLSHEGLHKIQFENWEKHDLYKHLRANVQDVRGQKVIRKHAKERIAEKFGLDPEQVVEEWEQIVKERQHQGSYFEMAARMISPKVSPNEDKYNWSVSDILTNENHYRFTETQIHKVLTVLSGIYGHYAETQPDEVDVAVSKFLGRHAQSEAKLRQGLEELLGNDEDEQRETSGKGFDFLVNRSQRLEVVPQITYEVLEEYL